MIFIVLSFRGLCLFGVFILVASGIAKEQEGRLRMDCDCIILQAVEEKPAPKIKQKPAPDVIVRKPDDLHIRFALKNSCEHTIYFLASTTPDEIYPAGYMIYRDSEEYEWKARFPGWRRERDLTGVTVKWVPLKAGAEITFEYSDISELKGERSIAIYVNSSPSHEGRVELLAKPFRLSLAERKQ